MSPLDALTGVLLILVGAIGVILAAAIIASVIGWIHNLLPPHLR